MSKYGALWKYVSETGKNSFELHLLLTTAQLLGISSCSSCGNGWVDDMQILLDNSAVIAYNIHTDMNLLRVSALNIWAGRKTRVHQTAGKTPAIFCFTED